MYLSLDKLTHRQFYIGVIFLIVAGSFLLYGVSLKNGFAYDDEGQIVHNPYIKSLQYLPEAFTSCIWRAYYPDCKNFTKYYRPFHTLSYLLTYAISAKAAFFHLVSIAYYAVLNFLVFLLVDRFMRSRGASVALLIVFLAHPVHSEAVMWISSVPELLFGIFSVLAFYLHVKEVRYREWTVPFLYFLALLSKETALLFPLLIFAYDKLFKDARLSMDYFKKQWRYLFFASVYALMRLGVVGLFPTHQRFGEFSPLEFVYGFFYSFGAYIGKIFWPIPLNPHMPFVAEANFANIHFLLGFGAFVLFLWALIYAYKKRAAIPAFGLAFYLVFILPALIFSAFNSVIGERYLLLPSLGIILAAGFYAQRFFTAQSRSFALRLLAAAIFAAYLFISAFYVIRQNKVWTSSKSLYEYIHRTNAARGFLTDTTYFNLALIYEKEGDSAGAKRIYEEIIADQQSTSFHKSEAYNNLGTVHFDNGEYALAMPLFERSVEYNPKNILALLNLAQSHYAQRRYSDALTYAIKALALQADYDAAWQFLRKMYETIGKFSAPELISALEDIRMNETWKKWEFTKIEKQLSARDGRREAGYISAPEIRDESKGVVRVDFPIHSQLADMLHPKMIFIIKGDTMRLISEQSKKITLSGENYEFSVFLLPSDLPSEIYFVLNDFRYYKFLLP